MTSHSMKLILVSACILCCIYTAISPLPIPPIPPYKLTQLLNGTSKGNATSNVTVAKTNNTKTVVKAQNKTVTPVLTKPNTTKVSAPLLPDENLQEFFPQDKSADFSGCYIRNPSNFGIKYAKAMVPLRNIDYNVEIVDGLVHFTLLQEYQNPSSRYLTVFYSFPIQPESCLYKFVAQFGNVVVQGIIKEKQQAKQQFEKAKSQGKQAALASLDTKSRDIIDLEIGNIPPKTKVKITISFIQEMALGVNTFYKLQVPSTISPRYMNSIPDQTWTSLEQQIVNQQPLPEVKKDIAEAKPTVSSSDTSSQEIKNPAAKSLISPLIKQVFPIPIPIIPIIPIPIISPIKKPNFKWNFNINLKSTKKITLYNSTTHKLKKLSQSEDGKQVTLTLQKSTRPNKDFVFVYTPQQFELPSYALGKGNDTYTVMLSFIPKFNTQTNEQAYKSLEKNKKTIDVDLNTVKGEYVFILDRSGSMDGDRIAKARQALIIFLRSLPEDCYFNIISFGSTYQKMYSQSIKYGNAKIKQTIELVQNMGADFGGTQIYYPLEKVLTQGDIEGYPKFVFLLTDGAVSNTEGVIAMAKQKLGRSRIYSIGIGNGASLRLIQGSAEVGRGRYVMIEDKQNPSQKIIELLESTLTPLITKFSLKYDEKNRQSITPNPDKSYILKDDLVIFYITFRGQLKQKKKFVLQYEDSVTKKVHNIQIEVDPQTKSYPFVNQMAHFKVLRLLQNLSKNMSSDYQGIYTQQNKDDYKKKAIRYSVHYQILSEYTSFLAIGKQLTNKQKNQWKQVGVNLVEVQQQMPIQYQQGGNSVFNPTTFRGFSGGGGGSSSGGGLFPTAGINGGIGGLSFLVPSAPSAFPSFAPAPAPSAPSISPSYSKPATQSATTSKSSASAQTISKNVLPPATGSASASASGSGSGPGVFADASMISFNQGGMLNTIAQTDSSIVLPSQPAIPAGGLTIDALVNLQNFDGSWSSNNLITLLCKNPDEANKLINSIRDAIRQDIVITKLALLWLDKRSPGKQYSLIIKKAQNWLKNAINSENVDQNILNTLEAL